MDWYPLRLTTPTRSHVSSGSLICDCFGRSFDQHVHATEGFLDAIGHPMGRDRVTDIGIAAECVPAGRFDPANQRLDGFGIA